MLLIMIMVMWKKDEKESGRKSINTHLLDLECSFPIWKVERMVAWKAQFPYNEHRTW